MARPPLERLTVLQAIKDPTRTRPVTLAELSAVTELPAKTLRRDIAAGELKAARRRARGSCRYLVPVAEARRYLQQMGHDVRPAA